jgi:ethanolamine utilization protein EutA (predicted chaperonin)
LIVADSKCRKGLNGLKGFEVRNITISLIPEADGTNMRAQVFIPNPSPMTIELGTVNQTVSVDGKQIAVATIPNLKLVPGDNLIDMRSASNQAAVLLAISNKYTDGVLPVTIVGDKSINSAGEELVYFSKALQSNVMTTNLTLGPALKAAGIDIVKPLGSSSSSSAAPSSVPSAVPPPAGPSTV